MEPKPGYIKHTVATKALLQIPMLGPWSLMGMQEVGPAKMHVSRQLWEILKRNKEFF